ncbi:MAG: TatD family hydrolase [Bacteroidales bacterium]|nr:TatD family hydrolase [Bacteroidales bacterium]
MLTDTHAHIYLPKFGTEQEAVLERAFASGIGRILMPNVDEDTFASMAELCERYPEHCFPMLGLHPTSVSENADAVLGRIKERRHLYKYCAIGEIGIDLHWDSSYLKEQIRVFEEQLKLSIEMDLPVVIHSRDAHSYVMESIRRVGAGSLRGVFHSFSGTSEELTEILGLGHFYVGINGVITFKNSNLSDVLKGTTPERIVLETDAPYLAPVPYRGKRNEPVYIWKTAERVADVFHISIEQLEEHTERNVQTLFNL